MEKLKTSPRKPLPRYAYLALVGVALGISYAAISRAIDSGSVLDYAASLIFFGLAIKNLVQAFTTRKSDER